MAHVGLTDVTYKVNNSTDKALHQKAHTSLWSLLRGAPRTSGIGLKAAYVTLTWGATLDYPVEGINVDLLSNLPGWTEILTCIATPAWNTTSTAAWETPVFVDQNHATKTSRLLMFVNTTGAAAHVGVADNRALAFAAGIEVLVIGY